MLKVNADVFAFVFASVIDPEATVMTAVPPVDGEAVKVAVYVVPLPVKPVSVPSDADTSVEVNVVVDSLTVKVTVVVDPEVTEGGLALIDTVGRAVSYEIDVVLLAVLLLPAVSVNREVTTERVPVPEFVLVVGVNTAEYTVDDVVVRVPILPPATVMSSAAKEDDASDSVKVIVSVWPTVSNAEPARVKVTVGAVVSTSITTAVLEVWVSVIPSNAVVAVERTL
jgi:hypothetical protein